MKNMMFVLGEIYNENNPKPDKKSEIIVGIVFLIIILCEVYPLVEKLIDKIKKKK